MLLEARPRANPERLKDLPGESGRLGDQLERDLLDLQIDFLDLMERVEDLGERSFDLAFLEEAVLQHRAEQENQEADDSVAANTELGPVSHRAHLERRLECPEGPLDAPEALVGPSE